MNKELTINTYEDNIIIFKENLQNIRKAMKTEQFSGDKILYKYS